ncbi:hypothetical protein [Halobiforma nitratireducens]|uniref:Uncharacterized protein n=1 Tax=Halobiforma nitratireducens JCM 10879 TaxID=1227454 RepID=M0M9A2_9EURY|nr:hypothetical protein [Halobiforma nitratireducens]EMA42326.1 hypothetical protein C446_04335 [Halobiforma nitratireducens JCM 10879]
MVSRENRVIAASFVLLVIAIGVLTAIDSALEVSLGEHPLPAFLVVVGIAVVLPQLYLAATTPDDGEEISPRARVRFAAVAIAAFAVLFASDVLLTGVGAAPLEDAETLQNLVILGIGGLAVLGLIASEFLAGYRSDSSPDDDLR